MVSLMIGLPAIIAEIEQRILACVPTAFATDTWVKADRQQYEAQNDLLTDYWRHFDIEISDSDPSAFQGNYAYQNRDIRLDIYTWYTRAGANRVVGNPDVDWQALMLQDAHDLQHALRGPIVTSDGSTGRLLYENANRSEDDQEATLVVSFKLPVFLRGTAQVPALYLGPGQQHALDGGSKIYLVAQSDLACSGVLASSPAGCSHDTALDLGSGTPQVIEVACTTAGTYTFTLTGAGGTSTCTVVVFASSTPISFNLSVVSKNPGLVELTYPDGITGPASANIEGARAWRTQNYTYLQATKGNAAMNAATAVRDQCTICMTYDLKNAEAIYRPLKAFHSPTLAMSHQAGATNRMNWGMWLYQYNENQSYIYFRQSVNNTTNGEDTATSAIGNGGIFINRHKLKLMFVLDGTSVVVYWKYFGTAIAIDSRTITRLAPIGTMGNDVLCLIGCEDFAYYARKLDVNDRLLYAAGTFPANPVCAYPMNEEAGVTHYDLYGTEDTALGIDQTYGFPLLSADNRNTGPNRIYTDTQTVVPWATVACVATESGTKTINGRRRRQGVPDRALEAEKWQLATATVVNGKVTVPMVFMD